MAGTDTALLSVRNVEITYGQAVLAVRGLSFDVRPGSVMALLGPNGAGKTTTLKGVSSLLAAERGQITRGDILLNGGTIMRSDPAALVARGLVQVLEGRRCFAQLSVEENLVTGGFVKRRSRRELTADLERIYEFFPRLREKRRIRAGYISGGEQQMTAIGRALMARPRLMVLDEPSMGLAPLVVEEIFRILRHLNRQEGISFLLAEQNAAVALRFADDACIIENGRVVLAGAASDLARRDDVKEHYFGVGGDDRVDWRDRSSVAPRLWLH